MAPKRKAAEPVNSEQTSLERSKGIAADEKNPPGTLAGASGQSVDTLLGRVGNKRLKARAAKGLKASSSAAFPLPKPRTAAEAVCGAPSQVSAAAAEQKVAQQEDQNDVDVASGSDWEWEDAAEDEEDWETAEAAVPVSASGVAGSFDIEAHDKAGSSKARRKGITKEEREMARLLHRTHLLCLLSRGLLFDQAASDPLLQATLLSLDSPQIASLSNPAQGISASALQPLLSWFNQTFQQQSKVPVDKSTATDEDFAAPAEGLHGVLEQLQAVLMSKQGTAEQLQALFVAVCRAQGLLGAGRNATASWSQKIGISAFETA